MLRQILLGLLPKEIARNADLVEALDMLLGFETWSRLRDDQGLGIAKAKRVLKQTIQSLLADEGLRDAGQADGED
jgi:hypothetical protein